MPAHMPKLNKDATASGVDGIGNPTPALNLLRVINARSVDITHPFGRYLAGFADYQSCRGSLGVVKSVGGGWHPTHARTLTGKRCHDKTVGKPEAFAFERPHQYLTVCQAIEI